MNPKINHLLLATLVMASAMAPSGVRAESNAPLSMFLDLNQAELSKQEAIKEAFRQGLIQGTPDGLFHPQDTLTRQEVAVLLARALKLDPEKSDRSAFNDLAEDTWGSGYIQAIRHAGLMEGDANGNFRPDAPITREELAAVFVRAVNGIDAQGGKQVALEDKSAVSPWAANTVDAAVRLGLVDVEGGKLNPKKSMKRQDIVSLLVNIFQKQERTAVIEAVDRDTVTIDGTTYLIEGKLKELIGDRNKNCLMGATITYSSNNRSIHDVQSLDIVRPNSVLDLGSVFLKEGLKISADGISVKGQAQGQIVIGQSVGSVQLDVSAKRLSIQGGNKITIAGSGQIDELVISSAEARVTLGSGISIDHVQLPDQVKLTQIFPNTPDLKQIKNVTNGSDDRNTASGGGSSRSNHAPTVVNLLSYVSYGSETGQQVLSLSGAFADEDGDELTYTATSSDTSVATVATSGSDLLITPLSAGTATITVTAKDSHNATVQTTLSVTVTAVNHAPTVANAPAPVSYVADVGEQTLSLSGAFADEDGDELTYTATSGNTSVATVATSGSDLLITPLSAGTATITVTAKDSHNATVQTTLSVTVTAVNHAPTVASVLTPAAYVADAGEQTLSLSSTFADEDGDELAYTATSSDTSVATVTTRGTDLLITPLSPGTATITVTATDSHNATVQTTLSVAVTAVNHAPTVASAPTPISYAADAGQQTLSLTSTFADQDGDELTFTATSSDTSVATVTTNGTDLLVTPLSAGTANITVTATDSHNALVQTTLSVTVTAVNHAPTVASGLVPVSYAADAGEQTLSLSGAFADEDGDALTYTATSGNTSVATVATSGTDLLITPMSAGTTTITVTATDSHNASVQTTLSVTVTVANHAPTVASGLVSVSYAADAGEQTLSLSGAFADEDGDELAYTATSSDTSVATVTMSGTDLLITPMSAGTTTITVTATDSHNASVQTTLSVTVTVANHAPTVTSAPSPVSYAADAGQQTLSLTSTFADQDGDELTFTATSSDTSVATVATSGTDLLVTPMSAGTATITVTAKDSHNATVQTTLSVAVTAVNHAPTVANVPASVSYAVDAGQQTLSLSGTFADEDGDELTYTAASSDTSVATVTTSGTDLLITPMSAGTATITVTATDSHNATVQTTLSVTVTAVNHAPTVASAPSPVSYAADAGQQTLSLTSTFADQDGDELTFTATSSDTSVATVTTNGSNLLITPMSAGTTTITITATDSHNATVQTTLSVTVTAVNHAPTVASVLTPAAYVADAGEQTLSLSSTFADEDGDALTYTATSGNTSVATVATSGTDLLITPMLAGTTTITVTATDSHNASVQTTLSVTVTVANHAPTVTSAPSPVSYVADAGEQTLSLSSTFADEDGDELTYTATSSDTSVATVATSGTDLLVTPLSAGTATITLTAKDSHNALVQTTLSVTVTAVNHAPTVASVLTPVSYAADAGEQTLSLLGAFADEDEDGDALTYTATSGDASVVTVTTSGTDLLITPVSAGTAIITLTATDSHNATVQTTLSVAVTAVNHAPTVASVLTPVSYAADAGEQTLSLLGAFADEDGDELTYTATSSDTSVATVTTTGSDLLITPISAGTAIITLTATDSHNATVQTTLSVAVTAVNHAPTVVSTLTPVSYVADAGQQTLSLSGTFADEDGDELTYTATSSDTSVATVTTTGTYLLITPLSAGTATITLTAKDSHNATVQTTLSVAVTAVNHAPTVVSTLTPVSYVADAGQQTLSLSGTFADEDGDELTFTATSSDTSVATATTNGTDLLITPVSAGTATITLTATDSHNATVQTTLSVTVTAVNHAPTVGSTLMPVSYVADAGEQILSLLGAFADEDDDALMYTATSGDASVATVTTSGTDLLITPLSAGAATITITATDSHNASVQTTLSVTVTAVNHAPTVASAPSPVSYAADAGEQTLSLATTFADQDGDELTYTAASSNPSVAMATTNGTDLLITPISAGTATITITATDSHNASVQTTLSVTVTPLNHAPTVASVPTPVSYAADAGQQMLSLATTFADQDGDELTYTAASSNPSVATVTTNGTNLLVTPISAGTATITITATDSHNASVQTTLSVTVTPLNHAPTVASVPTPVSYAADAGQQMLSLATTFADQDGDELTYTAASSNPSVATVATSGMDLLITPVSAGAATITITATDSRNATVQTTLSVTITAVNHAPTVVSAPGPVVYTAGGGQQTFNLSNRFADSDNDPLTFTATSSNTAVAAVTTSGGTLLITPLTVGTATITITATDTHNAAVQTTLSVNVMAPPNHAPTLVSAPAPVSYLAGSGQQTVNLSSMFTDADNDPLFLMATSGNTAVATVTISGGNLLITPLAAGTATVTIKAIDPSNATAQTTLSVTVTGVNHAPTVVSTPSPVTYSAGVGEQKVIVSSKFSDADNDPLTFTAVSDNTSVATVRTTAGNLYVTPLSPGTATVTITAADTQNETAQTTLSVTVDNKGLFISELVYGTSTSWSNNFQAIELYNPTGQVLDGAKVRIERSDDANNPIIPAGKTINPYQTLVIIETAYANESVYTVKAADFRSDMKFYNNASSLTLTLYYNNVAIDKMIYVPGYGLYRKSVVTHGNPDTINNTQWANSTTSSVSTSLGKHP